MSVDEAIAEAAADGVRLLRQAGLTIATAESLTGGLLGGAITGVAGASQVYRGGIIAYATDLKHQLLGVDAGLLAQAGPVDAEVAALMAEGARDRLGADYGIATTGVAGPDTQDGHPVGAVWVAIATQSRAWAVDVSMAQPVGDRAAVRRHTVLCALIHLGRVLRPERADLAQPGG